MEDDPCKCAESGDVEGMKRMLQRSDVSDWINKGHDGWTPLHGACINGHLEVMKLLVSSGANINCTNKGGWTPLHWACNRGDLEVANLLVSSGANVNYTDKYGYTPLHEACNSGDLEVANLLVSSGANVNYTDNDGWTPLHWACGNGHWEVVNFLVSSGAFVDILDKDGFSVVGRAFEQNHFLLVESFIEMEEKQQLTFRDGGSLLHAVCREKNVQMDLVTTLLERGLDASKRDKHGKQPADYLEDGKHKKELWLLYNTPVIVSLRGVLKEKEDLLQLKTDQEEEIRRLKAELMNVKVDAGGDIKNTSQHSSSAHSSHPSDSTRDNVFTLGVSSLGTADTTSHQVPTGETRHPSPPKTVGTSTLTQIGNVQIADAPKSSMGIGAVDVHDVKLKELIGQGGFGKVHKGECDLVEVAVKVFESAGEVSQHVVERVRQEVSILCQLRHPNIVNLYGLVERAGQAPMLVMELGTGGSLYSFLRRQADIPPNEQMRIAFELSRGLAHLHKLEIVHRDIKSLNVVLDQHHRAMWCDFGLASTKSHLTTHGSVTSAVSSAEQGGRPCGTLRWLAPEQFSRKFKTPSRASDVWSLGMVFFEIVSRKVPFSESTNDVVISGWIKEGDGEEVPEDCHPELAEIMRQCWSERAARPSAKSIAEQLSAILKTIEYIHHDYKSVSSS